MSDALIRALIVDDEPLARSLLREMLASEADVEVVGEASNGRAALKRIREGGVDVAFVDVEMPGLTGLELVEALMGEGSAADGRPIVVFVTAFDRYAVNAFEVHALDYLLKPLDEDRLARALDRVRAQLSRAGSGPAGAGQADRILALLEDLHRRERYPERLPIRVGDRTFLQPVEEIDWIEANGKYVNIHIGDDTHVMRETLGQVGDSLDPARFARISRSAIINVARIREVQPWFRGEYVVILHGGEQVTSTRAYRENLTRLLDRKR